MHIVTRARVQAYVNFITVIVDPGQGALVFHLACGSWQCLHVPSNILAITYAGLAVLGAEPTQMVVLENSHGEGFRLTFPFLLEVTVTSTLLWLRSGEGLKSILYEERGWEMEWGQIKEGN